MSEPTPAPEIVWTIVVAGGSGTRFGTEKQYVVVGDRRVLDHSLAAARAVSDGVVLVVPGAAAGRPEPDADVVVAGGRTRAGSVRAGLAAVPADATIVLVHDAARPAASAGLFQRVVDAVAAGADGVVPGIPVSDSLRRRAGGVIDRDDVVAVQTPQGFRSAALRSAHASGADATDDATLVEAAGHAIVVVAGERDNVKLTHAEDLPGLERALRERT